MRSLAERGTRLAHSLPDLSWRGAADLLLHGRVFPVLITIALFGVAAILAFDANTMVLQRADPARGHLVKGCYTILDDLLHTPQPNGVLRVVELLAPFVLVPVALVVSRARSRTED